MKELLKLTPCQLQAVASFSLSEICSWEEGKLTIEPIENWTDTQRLCADIIRDEEGIAIGVECNDRKLEALSLLAKNL